MGVKVHDFRGVAPSGQKMVAMQRSTIRPDAGAGVKALAKGLEAIGGHLGYMSERFTEAAELQKKTLSAKIKAGKQHEDALTQLKMAEAIDTTGFSQDQKEAHLTRLKKLGEAAVKTGRQLEEATRTDARAGLFGVINENHWLSTRWSTEVYN